MSPASKAQQKAVNKYMKKNYDRVNLVMPKGRKDAIRPTRKRTAKVSTASSTVPLTRPSSGTSRPTATAERARPRKHPFCLDDFEILVMRLKSRLGKGLCMRNLIFPKETDVRRTYEQHCY